MSVALRAVYEALGSTEEGPSIWRAFAHELCADNRVDRSIGPTEVARALRALNIAGSGGAWRDHLRQLGVLDSEGNPDTKRAESVAVALELVGDSFRSIGVPADWALVATLPRELRAQIDPPPVRQTAGVLLELIDSARLALRLAAPYVDDAGISYLVPALVAAGARGVRASIVTSTGNGQKFSSIGMAWPSEVPGRLQVTEVSTRLSPLGSHAKALVVDEQRAYVGSANFTRAGFSRNVELGVHLTGPGVADLSRLLSALERLGSTVLALPR